MLQGTGGVSQKHGPPVGSGVQTCVATGQSPRHWSGRLFSQGTGQGSPGGRGALLAGKIGPYLLLSIVQLALLFIAGRYLFGMAWGPSPGMLIPVVLATALAATGMGALVSSVVRNEAQVISCSVLIVITLGAVSGCFIPRQWMAESIQQVSLATPQAWSLIAFGELLTADRPDIGLVWSAVGILVAFATVLFGLGYWRMRKEL